MTIQPNPKSRCQEVRLIEKGLVRGENEEHLVHDGFAALRKYLAGRTPEAVLDEIDHGGPRGRGDSRRIGRGPNKIGTGFAASTLELWPSSDLAQSAPRKR